MRLSTAQSLALCAFTCTALLALPLPVAAQPTSIVVPTRLSVAAAVRPIDLRFHRAFRGRLETRTIPLGEGGGLTGALNRVTQDMAAAGYSFRDTRDANGRRVRVFTRPAREIARFDSEVTLQGRGRVLQSLDVQLDLRKPSPQEVQQRTRIWFAEDVDGLTRERLVAAYRTWISGQLDEVIGQQERAPVVLDGDKKLRLRRPERSSVTQSRPVRAAGNDTTLTVTVTSQVIDRPLGLP